MDIDIKVLDCAKSDFGRPFSVVAATANALARMKVGDEVRIMSVTDSQRRSMGKLAFRPHLRFAGERLGFSFMTRDLKDGAICHVWRVA